MINTVKLSSIIALYIIVSALAGCDDIDVPKPESLPAVGAPAPVKSTILIPIKISSESLLKRFESVIPKTKSAEGHGSVGDTITIDYETKYKIDREQIEMKLSGNEIALATRLSGYGNVVVPSQGLIPRTSVTMDVAADIALASKIDVNPDWSISSSSTSSLKVTKATTSILGFEVTAVDDLQKELQPGMKKMEEDATKELNALDLRTPVEKGWYDLAKPSLMDKAKSGWLTINPKACFSLGFITRMRVSLPCSGLMPSSRGFMVQSQKLIIPEGYRSLVLSLILPKGSISICRYSPATVI